MIKNVLLDLDETILDFHKAERIALKKALVSMGIEDREDILEAYKQINLSQWKRLELGEITKEEVKLFRYQILFERFGIDADAAETAMRYEENLSHGHFFLEGAEELLKTLYGTYRLFIVSNGTKKVQAGRIASAGIEKYMERIFVSEDIGYNKPSEDFFRVCFAKISDFNKDETVILGDSLTSDILGGINAGIHTIWFKRHDLTGIDKITPEYVVEALSEVPAILSKIH